VQDNDYNGHTPDDSTAEDAPKISPDTKMSFTDFAQWLFKDHEGDTQVPPLEEFMLTMQQVADMSTITKFSVYDLVPTDDGLGLEVHIFERSLDDWMTLVSTVAFAQITKSHEILRPILRTDRATKAEKEEQEHAEDLSKALRNLFG